MNVLIVEDDSRMAEDLKRELARKEEIGTIECAHTEADALELIKQNQFDFMILDLVMSQTDGFHVMEQLNGMHLSHRLDVIVLSAIGHETAIKKSFELGAKYYMIKPCDPDIIYARMQDIKRMSKADPAMQPAAHQADQTNAVTPDRQVKAVDHRVMEILLALGMPPHLKGYPYLREAIKMAIQDSTYIYNITKRLYPDVAKKFNVTTTKVELAIRHTIEVAWQRGKMSSAEKIFGCPVFTKNSRPTNGELIALVADKINMELNYV